MLVFSPSLFFCVPLFASWLSNFHFIVIFMSSSFPFLFIFISLSGPQFSTLLREGVCVDHLKRCKTSNLQGGSARLTDTAQRRHCQFVVIHGLFSHAYLHQFYHFSEWPPAKPRTGTSICFQFRFCTVATICLFYCFTIGKAASELEESSGKDVERIPSLRFLTSNLPNMPVSFTELFVHVRCIPHQ